MTLQFIHAYAIELEGSVSSKRPHLRGPGSLKKVVSLLRDGIDPRLGRIRGDATQAEHSLVMLRARWFKSSGNQ